MCRACRDRAIEEARPAVILRPTEQVKADREKRIAAIEISDLKARYKEALVTIERQTAELEAAAAMDSQIDTFKIEPAKKSKGANEATGFLIASDWHSEEIVRPETINWKNEHTPEIHARRAIQFFQKGAQLIQLVAAGVKIPHVVLALLGDFITNDIHDADSAENNALLPIDAILNVQNELASGIEYLLAQFPHVTFTIPCHSGNHGRTTQKVRHGSEFGHSLEYFMYRNLEMYFAKHPQAHRVQFLVSKGYHSFLEVYGKKIRFHHGHGLLYQGGVGGLYVPVGKAIAQWNTAQWADLDVFGHYHQLKDGGDFLSNGSMIGFNAYAVSIKAKFEPPRQHMFIIDQKHGRTFNCPILLK
jgi:hypothetical protein